MLGVSMEGDRKSQPLKVHVATVPEAWTLVEPWGGALERLERSLLVVVERIQEHDETFPASSAVLVAAVVLLVMLVGSPTESLLLLAFLEHGARQKLPLAFLEHTGLLHFHFHLHFHIHVHFHFHLLLLVT
jgi:hypothetical protein